MISVAETYDIVVQPADNRAFTIVAESVDRSGMGRAMLAPRMGMAAAVPPLRPRPILGMVDMGMAHGPVGGMDHGSMPGMDHGTRGELKQHQRAQMGGMVMGSMVKGDETLWTERGKSEE